MGVAEGEGTEAPEAASPYSEPDGKAGLLRPRFPQRGRDYPIPVQEPVDSISAEALRLAESFLGMSESLDASGEPPRPSAEEVVRAVVKFVEDLPRERLLLWKGIFDSLMHLASVSSLETLEELIGSLRDSSVRLEESSRRLSLLTVALVLETAVLAVLTALLLLK